MEMLQCQLWSSRHQPNTPALAVASPGHQGDALFHWYIAPVGMGPCTCLLHTYRNVQTDFQPQRK